MRKKGPQPIRRKLLNAWFVSTLSITLLLFLVGLLTLLVFNARYLNNYIRENIGLTLVLDEDVREVDLMQLEKMLSARTEVKSATYVDAESAAKILEEELGENFVGFLGYNPLQATIDVKLFAAYTHNDSLNVLEQNFLSFPHVEEVYYQRNLVNLINENANKISLIILVLGLIMLLIFFALINNTIRLSIYANRFIIHTMQLVGATRSFIRKPFVNRAIVQGLVGALLANLFLMLLIVSYNTQFREIIELNNQQLMAGVFMTVFVAGWLIAWLSTTLAVNKFLRLQYDELFY
jgi:cell division transport system permease protein